MSVISSIFDNIGYFAGLTITRDVLWQVLPLGIATIFIIAYFQRYKKEKADWDSYFSNSLVLLFVSIALFRVIYYFDSDGLINFFEAPIQSTGVLVLLVWGVLIAKLNFDHLLPEKAAAYLSSPLTVNSFAYVIILLVYSTLYFSWVYFLSLFLYWMLILFALNIIKLPLYKLFIYIEKEREKEALESIKEERFQIEEMKDRIRFLQDKLKDTAKKEEKQEKKAKRVKKIVKDSKKRK